MMPGLALEGVLMVLPLVNVVLLARDLFSAGADPMVAAVVVGTTLLYALAALSLAARVFGAESVLYSEQSSWSDLMRRPDAPRPVAAISAMLWCLALMVPIEFALLALLRSFGIPSPLAIMVFSVVVTILLFGALPALFVYVGRVELTSGLGLRFPGPLALLAGILLGASLWPLELHILSLSHTEEMLKERFGQVFADLARGRENIGWAILITGIVPAILEEAFFRGLLFNALKARAGAFTTIGTTGVLFGLTHVVLGGALGLERLVPATALGLILGVVCWRAESLWPSMILHVLHNTILLAVGLQYGSTLNEIPWEWLAGGAAGAALGAMCWWFTRAPLERNC
jgi:ABC-2 type transport system permease protein/sodium transport system permease protein